jgi:alpha-glucosidase (family GH31 glycosyl hydrolase)
MTLDNACFTPIGTCKVWDWSSIPQAESYFALHQPFEAEGVSFWWLDWCCDASTASDPGVTPDAWINHLYAQELANKGERGFVLSRTGSSYQNPDEVYPAGPWAGHTSTLAFTGDTWGTWNTLAFQAQLAGDEASIDEPYVSDDIGSFLGQPPGTASDDPDVYARWVQLGTFQPILRLHSSHGNRLPWDYPQPANDIAASFLGLREALVPYTYTLADEAVRTGLPITRPLYLDYPSEPAAYVNPGEYLYGPDVLVAPVTTPGTVSKQSVWFPPGQWTDWFTGATFTGSSEQTLTVPLDPDGSVREGRGHRPRTGSDEPCRRPARRAHDHPGVPGRSRPVLAL